MTNPYVKIYKDNPTAGGTDGTAQNRLVLQLPKKFAPTDIFEFWITSALFEKILIGNVQISQ